MRAIPLLLAPVLLAAGEALTPQGLDKPITSVDTARRLLRIAEQHIGRLYVSNLMVMAGLGLLGAAFVVLGRCVGSRLAAVAGTLGAVGGFCGALCNLIIGYDLAAAADSGVSADAAARVLVTAGTATVGWLLLVTYLGCLLLAAVLMSVALARWEPVPRRLAVAFPFALLVAGASPAGPVAVVMSLPFVAVMVALALRLDPLHHEAGFVRGRAPGSATG